MTVPLDPVVRELLIERVRHDGRVSHAEAARLVDDMVYRGILWPAGVLAGFTESAARIEAIARAKVAAERATITIGDRTIYVDALDTPTTPHERVN